MRKLTKQIVKALCLANNYYMNGDDYDFIDFIDGIDENKNLTDEDIKSIARDIKKHSSTLHTTIMIANKINDECINYIVE